MTIKRMPLCPIETKRQKRREKEKRSKGFGSSSQLRSRFLSQDVLEYLKLRKGGDVSMVPYTVRLLVVILCLVGPGRTQRLLFFIAIHEIS
jgi:hypothetical protein